jgi:hypothetical protein
VKSFRTHKFKQLFVELPTEIQDATRKAYRLWLTDPRHPSLHFKPIRAEIWSVRISLNYRAVGVLRGGAIYWHWIGSHQEYERIIRS